MAKLKGVFATTEEHQPITVTVDGGGVEEFKTFIYNVDGEAVKGAIEKLFGLGTKPGRKAKSTKETAWPTDETPKRGRKAKVQDQELVEA